MLKLFRKKTFDIEAFIAGSLQGMQLVNKAHRETWRLGQEQAWKVDEAAGRMPMAPIGCKRRPAPWFS